MKRDEQICEAANAYAPFDIASVNSVARAFYDGAKWADANPTSMWRRVEDELPKDGERCVIVDKDGRVRAAIYDAETKHWDMDIGNITYRYQVKTVLCWMSIFKLK